jgi:hypothetical protein
MISRRSLFGWIAGLVAAPVVPKAIPAARNAWQWPGTIRRSGLRQLYPVADAELIEGYNRYMRGIRIQPNSLAVFVQNKFDEEFGKGGTKVGQTIRIKLPTDYRVS